MTLNVGELLASAARTNPDRIAVLDLGHESTDSSSAARGTRTLSTGTLDAMARRIARTLQAHGAGAGSAVAVLSENSAELVAAWFGVVYAGSAVLPIAVFSAAPEIAFRLQHACCRALLFDRAREPLARAAAALHAQSGLPTLALLPLDELALAPVSNESSGRETEGELPAPTQPGDTAMLLYTSGTTAEPKGAAISHASLLVHTLALGAHALRLGPSDRVLGALPLSHSYGCRMVMLASLYAGATMVLVPRFTAAHTLAVLDAQAITWMPVVPTMLAAWIAVLTEPTTQTRSLPKPRALKWLLSAGAPLPDALATRAEDLLGVEVRQGYGMTEATFTAINAPPDERVLGSVGKPAFGVHVKIVDASDAARELPVGSDGEVIVRGHNVMTHYLHDEDASQQALAGGFMHSGDIGHLDAQGRLWIVDRKKDLVIRGGHNVYPAEVEAALATHPGVHEVAVIGRPDAHHGEEVVAVIVRKPGSNVTASELREHAAALLSRTKLPRELAFVEALPLGDTGKVHKRTLRAWLTQGRLALESA